MNIFTEYEAILKELIQSVCPDCEIHVESPKDKAFGDLTTNIAMVAAKTLKRNPMDIGNEIKEILNKDSRFHEVSVAKPGFINWKIDNALIVEHLKLIHTTDYGKSDLGHSEKVNIEYVSANPTGPLHAGHARGAIVGDALANLLKYAGYDVTKEYYKIVLGSELSDADVQALTANAVPQA